MLLCCFVPVYFYLFFNLKKKYTNVAFYVMQYFPFQFYFFIKNFKDLESYFYVSLIISALHYEEK